MAETVNIIQGTDRQFDLRILKSDGDPKPLNDANLVLTLKLPGEDTDLTITETPNSNASSIAVANAEGGRITVTLGDADTALLKKGTGNMELTIQEGAGPDFNISKVQFIGQLDVSEMLFE